MKIGLTLSLYFIAIILTGFTSQIRLNIETMFLPTINLIISLSPLIILTLSLMIYDMCKKIKEQGIDEKR